MTKEMEEQLLYLLQPLGLSAKRRQILALLMAHAPEIAPRPLLSQVFADYKNSQNGLNYNVSRLKYLLNIEIICHYRLGYSISVKTKEQVLEMAQRQNERRRKARVSPELVDGLCDMIDRGVISPKSAPDDFQWLLQALAEAKRG